MLLNRLYLYSKNIRKSNLKPQYIYGLAVYIGAFYAVYESSA